MLSMCLVCVHLCRGNLCMCAGALCLVFMFTFPSVSMNE